MNGPEEFSAERAHGALRELDLKLIEACRRSQISGVKSLLQRGASPYCKTKSGVMLLHWAAEREKPAVLKAFIEAGVDLTIVNREHRRNSNWNALHHAASVGMEESCKLLVSSIKNNLNEFSDLINERDADKYMSPLFIACRYSKVLKSQEKSLACVRVLIAGGADVNAIAFGVNTPLSESVFSGWTDVFALLISNGAHVSEKSLGPEAAKMIEKSIDYSSKKDHFLAMFNSARAKSAIDDMMNDLNHSFAPVLINYQKI